MFERYNLGNIYEEGKIVPRDYKKALEFYSKAAENGHFMAMNSIGILYEEGRGVEKDFKKAFECYEIAATNGHDVAM